MFEVKWYYFVYFGSYHRPRSRQWVTSPSEEVLLRSGNGTNWCGGLRYIFRCRDEVRVLFLEVRRGSSSHCAARLWRLRLRDEHFRFTVFPRMIIGLNRTWVFWSQDSTVYWNRCARKVENIEGNFRYAASVSVQKTTVQYIIKAIKKWAQSLKF